MMIKTTMTGSWFRPPEIIELLNPEKTPNGEISEEYSSIIQAAERRAIRDQLHPLGSNKGLDWISNGEQRKAGYTFFIPNRFYGFSAKERVTMQFPASLVEEWMESNPSVLQLRQSAASFSVPKIESPLQYHGEALARKEAEEALKLAREEGLGQAQRLFINTTSPGVITIFFPRSEAYHNHYDYLFGLAKELRKEYQALLSVDGIDIQIDAPDLAMGKQTGSWGVDFYEALPHHVDAINEAISGLPSERIRVHYCYGNWNGSHRFDADYRKVLEQVLRLKAGTIVGEMANPRHQGDALILADYLKEHDWPKNMKLAAGAIDVKSPIVESAETVAARLERLARLDKIGPERLLGGTDCGFETFASMGNVTYQVGLQKLKSLAEGAALLSERLGA
jgi:5-methyltetrahydropteroyltriglutamate--homocysteine methyltransferase